MTDLVAFLRARLDDDKRIAQNAGAGTWTRQCGHEDWVGSPLPPSHDMCCVVAGDIHIYDEGGHTPGQANHIARWDPARVLAEVAAKRRILARHSWPEQYAQELSTENCPTCEVKPSCATLRILAEPYANHSDYDVAWRAS